jgi:hypothetical protein
VGQTFHCQGCSLDARAHAPWQRGDYSTGVEGLGQIDSSQNLERTIAEANGIEDPVAAIPDVLHDTQCSDTRSAGLSDPEGHTLLSNWSVSGPPGIARLMIECAFGIRRSPHHAQISARPIRGVDTHRAAVGSLIEFVRLRSITSGE